MMNKDLRVDMDVKARRNNHWVKIDCVKNLSPEDACGVLIDKYGATHEEITLLERFARDLREADEVISGAFMEVMDGRSKEK